MRALRLAGNGPLEDDDQGCALDAYVRRTTVTPLNGHECYDRHFVGTCGEGVKILVFAAMLQVEL